MRRTAIAMLLMAACFTSVRAQQPQPSQDEETPSLSTDDVRPTEPVVIPQLGGSVSVDDLFERAYQELRRGGASEADVAQLRARLNRGEEVRFAIRFDVDSGGRMTNFSREIGTGLASVDAMMSKDATGSMVGRDVADFRNVRVEIGVTKARVHVDASATAPTVEKATELEQFAQMLRSKGTGGPSPFDGLTLSRSGADLSASITLSIAEIIGAH